ncbi:hypothetical protein B0A52_05302 [Exophiala mesophila]|uniref:Chalcone isomerase domain-containing protein n=1 Tax=Exophiala mesophila TaxID=212818 RepID=A0A438N4H3_EXOME|nr:hypothetical protein B0A52_05302 [Exophiala mesophila]
MPPSNLSPLQSLVVRRTCRCLQLGQQSATTNRRFLSTTASIRNGAPVAAFGSSELLRRRHKAGKEYMTPAEVAKAERAKTLRSMKYSAFGIALCAVAMFGAIVLYPDPQKQERRAALNAQEAAAVADKLLVEQKTSPKSSVVRLDAPPSIGGSISDNLAGNQVDQVPTGTSTIPTIPRLIYLPSTPAPSNPASANEPNGTESKVEYQLVGLGIRTVSILSIQVYVVGLYIAVADIAKLQERLVHSVADPVATTLVPGEKTKLRELLLDADRGEEIWNSIIKDGGIRTAFRITPTRNTDFMHLRDGFVRGITARSASFSSTPALVSSDPSSNFQDESFGLALNDFKAVFGGTARRKLPRGEQLYLTRDATGGLSVYSEDKEGGRVNMGHVADERVSRLLWLGYLAGKNVSSEEARKSVVDGCVEFVERPVGTVATQVV